MIDDIVAQLRADPGVQQRVPDLVSRETSALLIGNRWEGRAGWALFTPGTTAPLVVIKADYHAPYKARLRKEHDVLTTLGSRPELAGSVPEAVALMQVGHALVLAQSGLAGTPLSVRARQRLRLSARTAAAEHALILGFLARLHGDHSGAEREQLEGPVVVEQLQENLPDDARGGPLVSDIRAMAAGWPLIELPVLPGHGDMGPSNCLVDGHRVRVFDWEGGQGSRTPLADGVVFLNHYARAQPARGYELLSRKAAFRRAFLDDGWLATLTARTFRTYVEQLGLPGEAAEYLFVATLAQLAAGVAPISHAERARKDWTALLAVYAAHSPRSAVRRVSART